MLSETFKYPKLLHYFEEISSIPRMSYHEDKIARYLVEFAEARGLEYYTDEAHNVLINIGATEGYEDSAPVLLQGHTDMVCQKNDGTEHDFMNDGLELYIEDGYLKARGTTLGADDGIAVAFMLALLDGAIEHHPRCQCLFTSAEEVGLDGIKSFDFSRIYAKKMFNMDGAEEDIIVVGCAGGLRTDVSLEAVKESVDDAVLVTVFIGGLVGGHSGEDIGKGRINACKLAGELLRALAERCGARLVAFDGGNKDNAIPREARLRVLVSSKREAFDIVKAFEAQKKKELCAEDGGFFIEINTEDGISADAFGCSDTRRIAEFVNSVDNGVLRMSDKIEGLVEYSRNLGIVSTKENGMMFYFSSRSSVESDLDLSANEIAATAERFSGSASHHSRYPAWTYTGSSALADEYIDTAKRLYGMSVTKTALHAGLECGIVKERIPQMEMVTCGANARNIHSPAEALELASFERFFGILCELLKNCREK